MLFEDQVIITTASDPRIINLVVATTTTSIIASIMVNLWLYIEVKLSSKSEVMVIENN